MRKTLITLALSLSPLAFAQVNTPSIVPVQTSPDGQACSVQIPIKLKSPDGTLHTCQNGIYGPVGGPSFPVPVIVPQLTVGKTFTVTPQTVRGIVGAYAGLSTNNSSTFLDIFPFGYNPLLSGITFEDYATNANGAAIVMGLANDSGASQGIRFIAARTATFDSQFTLFSQNGTLIWAQNGDSEAYGSSIASSVDTEYGFAARVGWDTTNSNAILHFGGSQKATNGGVALTYGATLGLNYMLLCDQNQNCGIGPQKTNATSDPWFVTPAGAETTASTKIGTGTVLSRYARYNAVLTPAAVAANTCAAQSFTVTNVVAVDFLIGINKPTEQAGLSVTTGHVSGAGTATMNFCNNTASPITPTAGETYQFVVVQ